MNDQAVARIGLPRDETSRPEVPELGMTTVLDGGIDDIKARVVDALKQHGFGVLSEIDVQATLKGKLGADIEPYLILGACNPGLAYRALEADRSIGLLLPCNVVLRQVGPQRTEVAIIDPELMFAVVPDEIRAKIPTLPGEARTRLSAALEVMAKG